MKGFITKDMHAYLDYPVALMLMIAPFALNLGQSHSLAYLLSITVGVAALVLTLLTDHKLGVVRVLPYKLHLAVDFAVGVLFVGVPFVLGFKGIDMLFYLVVGLTVLTVVGLHQNQDNEQLQVA